MNVHMEGKELIITVVCPGKLEDNISHQVSDNTEPLYAGENTQEH